MLKVDNVYVSGWDAALRGMRNPLMSHNKSDSGYRPKSYDYSGPVGSYNLEELAVPIDYIIGKNDMKLCKALIKAGSPDRKFLRMIHVSIDITAPLYWWKEMDQYKVSTVTDSCSTMHKIHSRDLTLEDFSYEHLYSSNVELLKTTIKCINDSRRDFINRTDAYPEVNEFNKDIKKLDWWQMIQLLPTSYNQLRTWDGNYETLMSMYFQRRHHKLDEWHTFCNWILTLPYMKEFLSVLDESIIQDNKVEKVEEQKEELARPREKGSVKTEMDDPIYPPSNVFKVPESSTNL